MPPNDRHAPYVTQDHFALFLSIRMKMLCEIVISGLELSHEDKEFGCLINR